MKKTLLLLALCFGFTSVSHAGFGVGLQGGIAPAKGKFVTITGERSNDKMHPLAGIEVFWEAEAEIDALGVKIGYNQMLSSVKEEASVFYGGYYWYRDTEKIKTNVFAIPITAYYKYKATPSLHIIGGLGVSLVHFDYEAEFKSESSYGNYYDSVSKDHWKVVPHLNLGVEWRMFESFGLGADIKYLFGGKQEFFSIDSVDVSGLQMGITARYYF